MKDQRELKYLCFIPDFVKLCINLLEVFSVNFLLLLFRYAHINLSGSFVSLLLYPITCPLIHCNFLTKTMFKRTDLFLTFLLQHLIKFRVILMPKLLCKNSLQCLAKYCNTKQWEKRGKNNSLYVNLYSRLTHT